LAAELRITVPDGTALPTELETAKAMHRERGARAQRLALSTDDHGGVRELSGSGVGQTIGLEEGRAGLDALTIEDTSSDWASSELLGAGETTARLEVARATLDNWRNAGKVVAFRKGVRNYVYPIRQFERFGPIEGLDRVLAQFPAAEDAWEWLVTPNCSTGGEPPIERLKAKQVDEVARAAEGALDYA